MPFGQRHRQAGGRFTAVRKEWRTIINDFDFTQLTRKYRTMSKGYEKHRERMNQVSLMGKTLTRRSQAKCEVCEAAGVKLSVYEVPPVPTEPDVDKSVFICEECCDGLARPTKGPVDRWRCLGTAIWSEVPAVQVVAIRVLQELAPNHEWARELLDQAMLDEQIQAWADSN